MEHVGLAFCMVVLIVALMALFSVNWVYFKVLKIALVKDLVDNPDVRKLQKTPVPVMGGIAVFFGVLAGALTTTVLSQLFGYSLERGLMPIMCALGLMLYVGALDDILGLTPRSRLLIEILAVVGVIYGRGMCMDSFGGMWGISHFSWWLAVPFTVFAGVGIINAINMIDGVNGLSSGMCMTCSLFFGIAFALRGDLLNASLAMTMVGALIPFFVHNVFGKKSRMFIGDAGTMMMGVMMTWFLICLVNYGPVSFVAFGIERKVNLMALGLAILSVPVFDTLRVMSMRMLEGKSPFRPDKTHLHHVFIQVGVSHFITAMCEIHIGVCIVAIWVVSVLCGLSMNAQMYVVMAASVCLVWGAYAFLRYHERRRTALLQRIVRFSPKTHLGQKGWWKKFTVVLDGPEEFYITDKKE